jgi:hypothetical protein
MTGEQVVLTRDQLRVVQAVYDRLRELGDWPQFGDIDRLFATGLRRLDARRIIREIPDAILAPLGSASWFNPDTPLVLGVAGVALCKGSDDDIELFLRALRWVATQERRFVPAAAAVNAAATVDSKQFMHGLKIPKARAGDVRRVGVILMGEFWGSKSGGIQPDGTWTFTLTREVRRFARVYRLDDYRTVQEQWAAETRPRAQPTPPVEPVEPADASPAANPSYVDQPIIAAIEAKQATSGWKCDQLLCLIAELNDCYAHQNPHAAHAMLRAILDHVAPLFGFTDFARVADNHGWGTADNRYMEQLASFKAQADDALHRQISRQKVQLPRIDDLPARRAANRLLEECVARL